MQKEKISIIIPVYNVEDRLNAMLESVVHQTWQNIEIILVDDGSCDKCSLLCDQWEKHDCRITVIHQQNSGVSIARNNGFKHSTGEYIIFLDADDEIEYSMLESMMNILKETQSDAVCCGYENIFDSEIIKMGPRDGVLEENEIMKALFAQVGFFTAIWNKLFYRKVLLNERGEFIFFEQGIYVGEDALWLSQVLKNCNKVACTSTPYYKWIRRANSATHGGNSSCIDRKSLSVLNAYEKMIINVKQYDEEVYQLAVKRYMGNTRRLLTAAYKQSDSDIMNQLFKRYRIGIRKYPIKGKYSILFYLKNGLILVLIRIHSPYCLIDVVSGVEKRV